MMDVGRMCIKIAGREAGKHCVIVKKIDEKFVVVTGPKSITQVKRRRCNIHHLEPLMIKIPIKEDTPDEEIIKVYEKENIYEKLGIEKPKPMPEKKEKPKEVMKEKLEEKAEKKEKVKEAKKQPKETSSKKSPKTQTQNKK